MRTRDQVLRNPSLRRNAAPRHRGRLGNFQLAGFEKRLLEDREEILNDLQVLRESLRHDAGQDSGSWGIGSLEDATGTLASEHAVVQIRRLTATLDLLHAALARIKKGTYGLCMRCEDVIEPERLEAIPYARSCMRCKAA